jgi:multicomponent Na+:H+ antiporter subunit D
LAQGTVESGQPVLLAVLLLSGLLNAAYFLPIVVRAFAGSSSDFVKFDEAPPLMLIPLLCTALLAVLLGTWPDGIFHFYSLSRAATSGVFGGVLP